MNPAMLWLIGAIALSYLIGSIPFGLWLGLKLRSVDIRMYGSKNIGATNTLRVLGKRLGIIALICDMLKGAAAVIIGYLVLQYIGWYYAPILCGIAAIFGHVFPIFLRFRGGKGVATSTGVFLALAWQPTLCAAVVFTIVVASTRMVSAGSIAAAITLALSMFIFFPVGSLLPLIGVAVAALVVIKHRSNVVRILQGTESKLGRTSETNS